MNGITLYLGFGTGKDRTTNKSIEYPCILMTTGQGRDWKLSGKSRLAKIQGTVLASGGKLERLKFENPKTLNGSRITHFGQAEAWLNQRDADEKRAPTKTFQAA